MNRPNRKTIAFTALALAAFILIAGGLLMHTEKESQPAQISSGNDAIILAMQDFGAFAKAHPALPGSALCKNGFINIDTPGLLAISDRIVNNRILRADPLEYAMTQDDAGVSCLTSSTGWMLFTALNGNGADTPHHCIDSTGASGSFGIDRERALCAR